MQVLQPLTVGHIRRSSGNVLDMLGVHHIYLHPARPEEAAALLRQAQADVDEKYCIYEEFANPGGGPAPAQVTTAVAKALEISDGRRQ